MWPDQAVTINSFTAFYNEEAYRHVRATLETVNAAAEAAIMRDHIEGGACPLPHGCLEGYVRPGGFRRAIGSHRPKGGRCRPACGPRGAERAWRRRRLPL